MTDDDLKRAFAEDIAFLRLRRLQAGRRARRRPADLRDARPARHRVSEFQGGLRVTTPEAMDVVRMVLVGQVQRELVGLINEHGPLAVGLSGEDAGLFTAERTNTVVDGEEVDLGLVGEVAHVRPEAVLDLIEAGRIPVISRSRPTSTGTVHNVNADTAAAALAVALGAEKLLVLTDVEGLYRDWPDSDDVIGEISPEALAELLPSLASGHGPEDGRLPAGRAAAASRGPPSSTAASRTPCCSSSSPTRASAPRCCPASPPRSGRRRDIERPTPAARSDRYAAALMNTFGPPQLVLVARRGRPRLGRRRQAIRRPARRHRRQRARPRATRRWSTAVTEQLGTLGHVSNFFATAAAGRAGRAAARPARRRPSAAAGCSSPTPAPRPTRPRSSSPGAPAAPTSSPPRAASTAAPWARSR